MLASILLIVNALWNFDSSQWNIKNYTIKDGLNSNRVYAIVQDHRGRYWIASNAGLAYFDGYQFTYLTSENGVKNVDLVALHYNNKHLYSFSLLKTEAINIEMLNKTLLTKIHTNNIFNQFGFFTTSKYFYRYYKDSYQQYHGIECKSFKSELPFLNQRLDKVLSIKNEFPYINSSILECLTPEYYLIADSIFRINFSGNMIPMNKALILTKFTQILDSNYIFYHIENQSKSYIQSIRANKYITIFHNTSINQFKEYQNNGFFLTTYKNGIFLYTLKNYQKKNLSNFNYNSFYQTANLLNEQTNLEFDPTIKKTGQLYQFYNGQKWVPYANGIKSLIKLDQENFILGRRDGTSFFHIKDDQTKPTKNIDNSWVLRLKKIDKQLFILTYDNFKLLRGKTKKIFKLKYKGGYVLVNDLEYINNQYVLGTNDQGVFISDTGFKKFKHISETEGLQSKLVKQIKTDKQGNIWVLNDKGVDRINKDLTVTRVFSIAEIDDYDIENFSVSKDSLWLFTDNTVYSLSYAKRFKETKIPLVLNTLTVDNETKYYEADTNISIGPLWETIKINYAGIYLHEQDHIVYKYRIVREGDTGSWQKTKSNLLTLAALKSGNYLVQIQAFHNIYPNIHSEMLNTRFVIKPYFYQTWWFYLLIGLFILAAVVGFLYYRNQIKLRELKLESELNKYKLQGLQNQMNPHFIFNSMSTIQNLILNDDNKHALDFISDFSTLMRTMLQNSRNDEISLINELDFLQKYIHLEKVRYKDNFDFKIELKIDEFDLEDIYIPTMMVQPLLENAVKHGVSNLLNRSGLIIIDLSFENENENILCIQIIDNGIGMVNKQIKNHTSTALQVIQERLAIYSKNGIFGSLNINYTENGTTCILKIPV
ncbi:MAG: histidine kinase [Chitinophagales bacterium]|nr:histidine kinase [Sphingobacteriales bacterium]